MTVPADLLPHRLRPSVDEPEGTLLLLHGRGTSEHDLYPLLDALDPDRRLVGVTPRGPISLPPGGAHWYIVRQVGFPDRESFDAALAGAASFLDALPGMTGVPIERTVVGGFSQGAVMSYALALGAGRPRPAGVLAMSGFMPTVEGFDLDLDGLVGYPVAVTHGSLDPVIDVEFSRSARGQLESAGADVLYREAPIGHQIDPAWLPELASWLRGTVSATRRVH
jgi:phospholipase/carboxylesterase